MNSEDNNSVEPSEAAESLRKEMDVSHNIGEDLLDSRELFKGALDNLLTLVAVLEPDGKIIFANKTLRSLGGMDDDEIIGGIFSDASWWEYSQEAGENVATDVRRCGSGETVVRDIEMRAAGGRMVWIELSMHPVFDEDGEIKYVVPEGREIIDRIRAEKVQSALLSISEATAHSGSLETLLKSVHKILDTLIFIPNLFVALYDSEKGGYTFPYVAGEHEYPDNLSGSDFGKSPIEYIRKTGKPLLLDEDARLHLESSGELKATKAVYPTLLGAPIKSAKGVIGVVAVYSYDEMHFYSKEDLGVLNFVSEHISVAIEQRLAEQNRLRLEENLARAERMEYMGLLAGGVAHDLNNILGPILAYPDLMLQELPEDSPLRNEVNQIKYAAERAMGVVADLLTLARRGRYEMKPINLNDTIRSYVESAGFRQMRTRYPKVEFETSLDEKIPPIMGSEAHLVKILMNLINNAFEVMPDGGSLRVRTVKESLDEQSLPSVDLKVGSYVILEVEDTGKGISREDLPRIFEPFYSKKEMGASGTGLGLSVVLGVVQDHSGYINAESEPDVGTKFSVYLPAAGVLLGDENEELNIEYKGTEKILVVEDDKEQRELAVTLLERAGFEAESVEGGRAAVEFLKENEVDLILLDMILEDDFDGLDTLREIRKIQPKVKSIIVSGFTKTKRVDKALELGAGRFVTKPFDLVKIGVAVREELDRN